MNKFAITFSLILFAFLGKSQHLHFYPQSVGNIYNMSTWGSLPDGSGPSPTSFSMNNAIFHFQNRTSFQLFAAGNLTINGINSGMVIGNGISFTNFIIPIGYQLQVDSIFIDSASQLTNSGAAKWNKSHFSFHSTVVYNDTNNFQQIWPGEYGRLNLLGGPTTRFWPDTRTKRLKGNVQVNNILYLSSLVYCDSFYLMLGSSSVQPGNLYYELFTPYGGVIGTFKRWMPNGSFTQAQGLFPMASMHKKFQWVTIGTPVEPMFGGLVSVEYRNYWPATFGLPIYDSTGILPFQLNKVEIGHFKVVTENGFSGGRYSINVDPFDMGFIIYPYALRLLKRNDSLGAWRLDSNSYSIGVHSLSKSTGYSNMPAIDGEYVISSDSTINVLPVDLTYLKGEWIGDEVKLKWTTVQERNADFFRILRVENNSSEEKVRVKASGNSNVRQNYSASFLVEEDEKEMLVLFEAFDRDGNKSFSRLISLQRQEAPAQISFYPNPFKDEIKLNIESLSPVFISIFNPFGQLVWSGEKSIIDPIISTTNLENGVYYIQATCEGVNYYVKQVKNE